MRRFVCLFAVMAPVFLLALARGEDAPAPEEEGIRATVCALVKTLHANKGAVRVGLPIAEAASAQPGAAKHVFDRYMSLRGSWLDKAGRLDGIVNWDEDLASHEKVDSIRVVLVTGRIDRKEMGKAVAAAGAQIGLDVTPDSEDPDTWFDASSEGAIDLWISIGDGVVVLEVEAH